MLSRLIIRNYALIEDIDISFSDNLNIITGETGAGKSIILGALSLLLGQRAESKYFYNQQKKCVIEGVFKIDTYKLESFFDEKDLDYETSTVLRREITADGKSRAFINDTPVNLATLREIGESLIDIHTQHATSELNDEKFQTTVIDTLAGNESILISYSQYFKQYKKIDTQLKELEEQSRKAKNELDYYQFQLNELESAHLQVGEQEELERELTSLNHAEEIKRSLLSAIVILQDSEQAILPSLKDVSLHINSAARYITSASELARRINSSFIELKDIVTELEELEQATFINEERSLTINERLNTLYNLQKKHHVNTIEELLSLQETLSEKLHKITFTDEKLALLQIEHIRLKDELIQLSETLSASRNQTIPMVEQRIREILAEIGMPNSVLKIQNDLLDISNLSANGRNKIQFLFTSNKGQAPAPMTGVASGGELSRLMLSIKSLISRHVAQPTIIFDEIDTGVSGGIALKVGKIMEQLSQGMQVISITHLPQIASRGDHHYFVYKDEKNKNITHTNIVKLSKEDRIVEIASMLSGENPGESAIQNAKELLFRAD